MKKKVALERRGDSEPLASAMNHSPKKNETILRMLVPYRYPDNGLEKLILAAIKLNHLVHKNKYKNYKY